MTDDFWNDRFHWCALAVGFEAAIEGWLHDSERVRRETYAFYESGGFRDRMPPDLTSECRCATACETTQGGEHGTRTETQTATGSG